MEQEGRKIAGLAVERWRKVRCRIKEMEGRTGVSVEEGREERGEEKNNIKGRGKDCSEKEARKKTEERDK